MFLDLKRYDQGTWYPWSKSAGIRFKIRPLSSKKLLELRSESKRGKVAVEMPSEDPMNPGQNLVEIVDDYNDFAYEWKMFSHCLEDWEGFTHGDGVEADKEKVKEAIFNHLEMRRFVIFKSFETMKLENKKLEDELKNLEGSPVG